MVTDERAEKIRRLAANRQQGVVVIEDVYDPHNAAAVFRSADAFGFAYVDLICATRQRFKPSKPRGPAASAERWLSFRVFDSTEQCLGELKEAGYTIAATVADENAEDLYAADLPEAKLALLLGNEHAGLSETAVAMADRKLRIPLRGMVQSLNLSVTAAVFLAEITRKRGARGMEPYLLPAAEREALRASLIDSEHHAGRGELPWNLRSALEDPM